MGLRSSTASLVPRRIKLQDPAKICVSSAGWELDSESLRLLAENSLVSLQVAKQTSRVMEQELVPVVGESLGSAVNHEAENGDSKVGELLPGSDKSEGAVEEPRPEKKGFFARAAEWNWKNIFIAAVLWLGYFFVNTAYSTIELFFPNEVGEN